MIKNFFRKQNTGESVISFPKLIKLNWRVDVTITTSELDRVLKPTILMRMVDDKGDIHTFEMTPEKFHKLRYSVARVLKVKKNDPFYTQVLIGIR